MTRIQAKPLDLFKPVTIDAELVKQLESDLRRMTKIYKAIPTEQKRTSEGDLDPEDQTRTMTFFNEAKRLFKNFNDNLEGLVSQVLNEPREAEEKNWTASALRKYAWSFMHELRMDSLFPTQWDHRTDKYIPAPWTLKAKRDNNIRRYQKAARPFFEALNDWTDYMTRVGQPTTKPATIEKTTIAGIPVVIHNTEREEWANDELEDFIRHLDVAKAKLKRAGFEKAYEGMTLHVAFDKESRKGLTAGRYNPATDELWVYPLGMSRDSSTFIHEVGHRFYFKRLGNNAKHEWERIIGERFVKVTPEAVDMLIAEMRKHPDIQSGFGLTSREALALVEKMDLPEGMAAQLRYLADHQPYKKDIDELRQWHLSENVGAQVATEHITDYGDTNAWEAFAEAFKLYVSKGPGAVGPWTRQFFKEISRAGGAQIRSSMDRAKRTQAPKPVIQAKPIDLTKPVTIDKELVKQLESDLRRMTKIYKAIPTAETKRTYGGDLDLEDQKRTDFLFNEARHLFEVFRENLEGLVTQQALNEPRAKWDWASDALRGALGQFLFELELSPLFPAKTSEFGQYVSPSPAWRWMLKNKRDNNIRRYQSKARAFFEALNDWIDTAGRTEKSTTKPAGIETTNVAGFPVVIHRRGEDQFASKEGWAQTAEQALNDYLPRLHEVASMLKKAGFGKAIRDMTLDIDLSDSEGRDAAGSYSKWSDTLTLHPWGFVGDRDLGVIIHEIGHRFWYKNVPPAARAEWEELLKGKTSTVTQQAVDIWMEALKKGGFGNDRPAYGTDRKKLLQELAKQYADDPFTLEQVKSVEDMHPGFTNDLLVIRDHLTQHAVGEKFSVEKISDYANTNPVEAFAEAFRFYVVKGPGYLGPWTRQFFREISRTGGAQIRSSMDRETRTQIATALRAAAAKLTESASQFLWIPSGTRMLQMDRRPKRVVSLRPPVGTSPAQPPTRMPAGFDMQTGQRLPGDRPWEPTSTNSTVEDAGHDWNWANGQFKWSSHNSDMARGVWIYITF